MTDEFSDDFKTPESQCVPQIDLDKLADNINENHLLVGQHARQAVTHGILAGEALLQAKAICPSGEWQAWMAACCHSISQRTARVYTWLATHKDQLAGARSIREAIRLARPTSHQQDDESEIDLADKCLRCIRASRDDLAAFIAKLPAIGQRRCAIYETGFFEFLGSRQYPGYMYYGFADCKREVLSFSRRPIRILDPLGQAMLLHAVVCDAWSDEVRITLDGVRSLEWGEPENAEFNEDNKSSLKEASRLVNEEDVFGCSFEEAAQ
jgi:hypothetical protein